MPGPQHERQNWWHPSDVEVRTQTPRPGGGDRDPLGVFEYVSVLTSIVIGLGIAHLLKGVVSIMQHPARRPPYFVHLFWVAFMFFQAVFWWWWEFKLDAVDTWTFELYLFVLFYAVIIYLMCALLFPSDLDDYAGYEDFFMSRRRWFLGLLATYFVIDFWDTWLKGGEHFASLGLEYPISSTTYVALCLVGIRSSSRRFHAAFAVAALLYQVSWALRYYGTIG